MRQEGVEGAEGFNLCPATTWASHSHRGPILKGFRELQWSTKSWSPITTCEILGKLCYLLYLDFLICKMSVIMVLISLGFVLPCFLVGQHLIL